MRYGMNMVAPAVLALFLALPSSGQDVRTQVSGVAEVEQMVALSGALYAEDMGEEEIERLVNLQNRPLKLNLASRSRLTESGLFSQYQVAALMDYRERNGDILSVSELAAVDGFGREAAEAVEPFVSFESSALPGRASLRKSYIVNELVAKAALKLQAEDRDETMVPYYNYGVKYRFSMEDCFEAAVVTSRTYDTVLLPPEAVSFYAAYYGRGTLGKVVIGDFNTRFGQGLGMWSGFSMSGVPSQGAFSRRPSGISPYWSYSGEGSHRGAAADFSFGNVLFSTFASFPGVREAAVHGEDAAVSFLPGFNIAWSGMDAQASVTCFACSRTLYAREDGENVPSAQGRKAFFESGRVSADMRYNLQGTELFSEAAIDFPSLSVAALAGCRFRPCSGLGLAAGIRYYPADFRPGYSGAVRSGSRCSNEYGIAVSGTFSSGGYVALSGKTGFGSSVPRHQGGFSADLSRSPEPKYGVHGASSQCKVVFSYQWQISGSVSMVWKLSERMRSYGETFRTDVRCDLKYSSGKWFSALRLNVLQCVGTGMLSYAECGCRSGMLSACLRGGLFRTDDWDDRIYAYERDAPGNFSVPAFYGRGFWTSFVAGVKVSRLGRFYVRASYTGYPWLSPSQEKEKPGRAELKFQMMFRL